MKINGRHGVRMSFDRGTFKATLYPEGSQIYFSAILMPLWYLAFFSLLAH